MPYLIRCKKCNWISTAKTQSLGIVIDEHDENSHKGDNLNGWTISIITQQEYDSLTVAMQFPAFWTAIRRSPNLLPTPFSAQRSGEK
jgi:hypothetical protein